MVAYLLHPYRGPDRDNLDSFELVVSRVEDPPHSNADGLSGSTMATSIAKKRLVRSTLKCSTEC
jgi:hypothetical protein